MNCQYCGMIHQSFCPRIKAIEYNADGVTVRRIEFHAPLQVTASSFAEAFNVKSSTATTGGLVGTYISQLQKQDSAMNTMNKPND